jgi:hypothetical protein
MGAVNPKGVEKYWFEGLPLKHLFPSTGSCRYNLFELQLDWDRI